MMFLRIFGVALFYFVGAYSYNRLYHGYKTEESLERAWMWPLLTKTRWADGFSPLKFRKIRTGMSVREVEKQLGHPLSSRSNSEGMLWIYSQRIDDLSGDLYWLQFNTQGAVTEILHRFYID